MKKIDEYFNNVCAFLCVITLIIIVVLNIMYFWDKPKTPHNCLVIAIKYWYLWYLFILTGIKSKILYLLFI